MTDPKDISNVNPDPAVQRRYADRTLGALSVFMGVTAIMTGMIPSVNWFTFIFAVPGVILGIISIAQSRRAHSSTTMAVFGIVLNLLGAAAFLIMNLVINKPVYEKDKNRSDRTEQRD